MTEYEFVGDSDVRFQGKSECSAPELSSWETYRNHREIVNGFISSTSPPHAQTLCVLGAGQCLDIDLNELIPGFNRVTLVDLRPHDIHLGLRNQNLADATSMVVIGPLDISGVSEALTEYADSRNDAELAGIIERAASFSPRGLETFDCVVSTCLISQILCHASESVSDQHPEFLRLLQTLRQRHIEIMLGLLNSGGTGLLITDFVSSESLPELFTTTNLKGTLQTAIASNNFLHGLNPAMVGRVFQQPPIVTKIRSLKVTDPWRWVMPQRIYACFAIIFSKV